MGYELYDLSDVVNTVNAFANGEMTIDELQKRLQEERED
jgi:hypothetical protein